MKPERFITGYLIEKDGEYLVEEVWNISMYDEDEDSYDSHNLVRYFKIYPNFEVYGGVDPKVHIREYQLQKILDNNFKYAVTYNIVTDAATGLVVLT